MEQALIFASIIVGVAVSDQILSLNRLLRSEAPVRWHWIVPIVALQVLMTNVQTWWLIAGAHLSSISIGQFLPMLIELILLALLSAASLPDRVPEEGIDLHQYYRRHARYLWLLYALSLVWFQGYGLVRSLDAGVGLGKWGAAHVGDGVALGVMLTLAFVRRWWLVAIGLALLSIGPLHWLSDTLH
jgi:hypothetical protein